MKQTCILVMGMHRSGTSAMTGLLETLGVYLGSELMAANEANPKGYFENDRLYRLNEKLLSQSDSSWQDVFYDVEKIGTIDDIEELKQTILEEFKYSKRFAIKDPRLMYLFPLYERALKALGIEIKVILSYRNPYEVAHSLRKRDGFSIEKSLLLWSYHFLLAEKYSRKYDRVFVGFDELLAQPKEVVKHIDKYLHTHLMKHYDSEKIAFFLSKNLKHHNIDPDNLSDNVPGAIRKIMSLRAIFNEPGSVKKFNKIGKELYAYRALFYNEDFKKIHDDTRRLSEEWKMLSHQVQNKDEELRRFQQDLASIQDTLIERDKTIEEIEARFEKEQAATQEKTTKLESELKQSVETIERLERLREEEQAVSREREAKLESELKQSAETIERLGRLREMEQAASREREAKLESELKQSAETIERLEALVASLNDSLKQQEEQNIELQKEQKDTQAQLQEKKKRIADMKYEIEHKQGLVSKLQKDIEGVKKKQDEEKKNRDKIVANKNAEIASLRSELVLLYMSKSWKLTRPLRKLKRWRRRIGL